MAGDSRHAAESDTPPAPDMLGALEFFEMSLDHLCIAGFDGYFKRVSSSWTTTLGWTAEELLSTPSIEFVHPDDRAALIEARVGLRDGRPLRGLLNRYRAKDGTYRWFEWNSVPNVVRGHVYAAARDVTRERESKETQARLQQQLILADRLASVGTLAAGVAHEINNPLAAVTANLDLLAEDLRSAPPQALTGLSADWPTMLREARDATERIGKIVRGLETFARTQDERRVVLDVHRVLELAADMTANEIRHRARLIKDYGDVPSVDADEARLAQVFINLLVNAAQAVGDGHADREQIRLVTSTDAHGNAVIEVQDTGPGIPPEVLERLFDPFFTTKPIGVGTGLGLSVCHNLVSSMGGEVSAQNREGGGATFRVVLPPARVAARTTSDLPAGSWRGTSSTVRVLIVDDERAVGSALGRVLRGHEVTIVTSAPAALDAIEGADFDVVLSDLMMPEVSGMDLYDELARRRPELAKRMVFITGGAFTPAAISFLDRVPNERIKKPFDVKLLRALVQQFAR